MATYLLFESASGYALFQREEGDEVVSDKESLFRFQTKYSLFSKLVKLKSFESFASSSEALEEMNQITEGILTPKLKAFLELNLTNITSVTLGVSEDKLKGAIYEALGVFVESSTTITELFRGIRYHFQKFINSFTTSSTFPNVDYIKTQLGLGHAYSRAKIKFNVHKSDNMIIQVISLLDQLDKDVNLFAMRVREWYSWHFPELFKIVPDNVMFSRAVRIIKKKETFVSDESRISQLKDLLDEDMAMRIVTTARTSMGTEINEIDLINITLFANRVVYLAEYRKELNSYLSDKMNEVAPNLSTLIGEMVGARLISHAGSLRNLAKCPASTVQILGAEKALFRALKTRGNTPKFGLLFNASQISKSKANFRGQISRFLANKCSLASRIDFFLENSTNLFGKMFKEQVEERMKFLEKGTLPRKNLDVMKIATEQLKMMSKVEPIPPQIEYHPSDTDTATDKAAPTEEQSTRKRKRTSGTGTGEGGRRRKRKKSKTQ